MCLTIIFFAWLLVDMYMASYIAARKAAEDAAKETARNSSTATVGSGKGLHLIFPSFDGHVYAVDGRTGCADKIDISEKSYSMVLADDILGNGIANAFRVISATYLQSLGLIIAYVEQDETIKGYVGFKPAKPSTTPLALIIVCVHSIGYMDLLVTTMNGNVFCFSTNSPYHPLKSW